MLAYGFAFLVLLDRNVLDQLATEAVKVGQDRVVLIQFPWIRFRFKMLLLLSYTTVFHVCDRNAIVNLFIRPHFWSPKYGLYFIFPKKFSTQTPPLNTIFSPPTPHSNLFPYKHRKIQTFSHISTAM